MRTLGVNEKYITGNASDRDKFLKWAETVPHTVRNPLYHWTHLEFLRYFGIDSFLSPENAETVYDSTAEILKESSHHTVGLLEQQNVETVCTTDDPADSLEHHKRIAGQDISINVYPIQILHFVFVFVFRSNFAVVVQRKFQ